jgi:hypothetical protein
VIDLISVHLFDIINCDTYSDLILNTVLSSDQLELFQNINGFQSHLISDDKTSLRFNNIFNTKNKDVTAVIQEMKKLTQSQIGTKLMPIEDVYNRFITNALSVGQIYSTYVEIVLCNMYITKQNEIFRYALQNNINVVPFKKLNIMKLHTVVSKLLGLLYEPNSKSISEFSNPSNKLSITANTVLERFWNEM